MRYMLFHLYGPFAIHSYGLCIGFGIFVFSYLIKKNERFTLLKLEPVFPSILICGILSTFFGARIFYLLSENLPSFGFFDFFNFYEGGLSILGGILGILIVIPAYLYYLGIPIIAFLDLIALYAGVLQSISRVGCFFAGCCHGIATTVYWAVHYHDHLSMAPLYVSLHPTQLYSSFALLSIFFYMLWGAQYQFKKPGQLFTLYIILICLERFIIDFWRADRTMTIFQFLSLNQIIALILMIVHCALFLFFTVQRSLHIKVVHQP